MPTIPPYATFFDAVLKLAREVVVTRQGTATSGTTSTLDDTEIKLQPGIFVGGTLFNLVNSEFRKITNQTASKITVSPVMTINDAGDAYVVANPDIPLDQLMAAVNGAIRDLVIPIEDITTLAVAGQEEYTLPANISGVMRVEVATSLTSPYGYQLNQHWREVNGKLRFPSADFRPPTDDNIIKLTYRKPHTDLVLGTAALPNDIDVDYIHWSAVQKAAKYGLKQHGTDPKRDWPGKIQEAEVRIQRLSPSQTHLHKDTILADW